MRKILLLMLTVMLCLTLCSCEALLNKAKYMVTGEEPEPEEEGYITTLENDEYSYKVYEEYIKVIKYIVENGDGEVIIPSEIDGKPVTKIGSLCFYDLKTSVVSVVIPDSVTEIEESAFYYADKLKSIEIPDSVTKVGARAFAWCNALENITFGTNVTEIPEYCFNHCESLLTLTIPSTITKIGVRAFSYCENLTDVAIAKEVTEIGNLAFAGCLSLQFATFENPDVTLGTNLFDKCENVVIISPDNSNAKTYCEENNLRWSTSKDIEAVILGGDESSPESTDSSVQE